MKQFSNEKFLIIKNIKKFILELETLLITFPKKDMFTKDRVYNDALELIEYKIKALGKINKLDFYLERAYKLKYISEKQLINKSGELAKINRMIYAWCKNDG